MKMRLLAERANSVRSSIGRLPLYPELGAAAFILSIVSTTYVPPEWLLRPLVVAVSFTALIHLLLTVLLKRADLGAAAVASVLVLAVTGNLAFALVPFAATTGLAIWELQKPAGSRTLAATLVSALNVLGCLWLLISVAASAAALIPPAEPSIRSPAATEIRAERPDVWVLILDGYARTDTLAELGYDNEPFLRLLSDRGFSVARETRSEYPSTGQTIPTMLHMAAIEQLPIPADQPAQTRAVWALTNTSPVVETFRSLGYEVLATVSHTAPSTLRAVDRYFDTAHVNELESHLLQVETELDIALSMIAPDWLPNQYRQRVQQNFRDLRAIASEPGDKPKFVWGHVMAPHAPFVFDADGSLYPSLECFPETCTLQASDLNSMSREVFIERYSAQIEYVNSEVISTVDAILANAVEPPIVVVISDHGSRYNPQDGDEPFRNFFAALTPGHDDPFGPSPRPTDLFRTLFSRYFALQTSPTP